MKIKAFYLFITLLGISLNVASLELTILHTKLMGSVPEKEYSPDVINNDKTMLYF